MRFEDLEVWKRGVELSASIYLKLKELRDYGFKDQITRSGLSIPSNVAEGFERTSQKEAMAFLSYAKGSSGELRTQIIIGMKIGYVPEEVGKDWLREAKEISSMLSGLIKKKKSFVEKLRNILVIFIG
jgi:four helix bundle protein